MLDVFSPSKFYFLPSFEDLQLGIVGFLAILGEGSVLANAQVSSLSSSSSFLDSYPHLERFFDPTDLRNFSLILDM